MAVYRVRIGYGQFVPSKKCKFVIMSEKPRIYRILMSLLLIGISDFSWCQANLAGSGNCLDFDDAGGSNGDYVALPSGLPAMVNADFTIAAWVNSDNVGSQGQRIFCWDESNRSYGFSISLGDPGSGRIRFYIRGANPVSMDMSNASYYLTSNTWYHVAVSHDAGANRRTIYVNGMLAQTGTYSNNPSGKDGIPAIGGETNSGETSNRFNGEIDEFSIWSTVLTQTQIRDLMCSKLIGNETNLLAYYRFDESSGTTAQDATGNYSGTLVNMDPATDWVTSGASVGNTSSYSYAKGSWGSTVVTHTSSDGDSLQVSSVSGNPECVHIYNVSAQPSATSGILGLGGNSNYYGVFHAFGSSTTYTATQYYGENNAFQASDPSDEAFVKVFTRSNNSSTSWVQGTGTLNQTNNTLTLTALSTEFVLGNSQNPLPVEFIGFEGFARPQYNELRWSTASEISSDVFVIERSLNGLNWEPIGEIKAAGFSNSLLHYAFKDEFGISELNYYRIKEVDFDGKHQYSNVIAIDRANPEALEEMTPTLSLFPNPVNEALEVTIQSNQSLEKYGFCEIYDSQGKFVASSPLFPTSKQEEVILKFPEPLTPGNYLLKLVGSVNVRMARLMVY